MLAPVAREADRSREQGRSRQDEGGIRANGQEEAMQAVVPSTGWGVTHLYYRVHPDRAADPGRAGKELVAALDAFAAEPDHQVLCSSVLGLKADLGIMALGPDLACHDALRRALRGAALEPAFSYVSVTEVSEYVATAEETRARLLAEHGPDGLDERLAETEARLARYRADKLHPRLPRRALLAFYPMSKAREPGANWYQLPFDDRRRFMSGHAAVGRRHAGKVLQLITASTGLDDFEWGVTLLSDDLTAIKEVVYDMRFDEVTAAYGRFGPFLVGLTCEPAELPERLGLA
jgi:hydrogen peroxide-dependent heme synthase